MLNTFCKKYLKAEELGFDIISVVWSLNKVIIGNLPPDLAYFQSLASNSSTRSRSLPWMVVFYVKHDGKLGGKSELWFLYAAEGYLRGLCKKTIFWLDSPFSRYSESKIIVSKKFSRENLFYFPKQKLVFMRGYLVYSKLYKHFYF